MSRGHGAALPALMADALATVTPTQIQGIVVTHGPGGFTGMRAGLAYARAFALARAIPAYGVSVDAALSLSLPQGTPIAIDSRRGDYFMDGAVVTGADVRALGRPVAGSWNLAGETARVGWHEPCPRAMARHGWHLVNANTAPDPAALEPLYLRAPSVG